MKILYNGQQIEKLIKNIAQEIIKNNSDLKNVVFIGMLTRGIHIAERVIKQIKKMKNIIIPSGTLDITFYRDDIDSIENHPIAKETSIAFDLTDKQVILVDDVLYTGRSIRAAMYALIDFGRPKNIQLAVLIDRGHRELPIQADYTGTKIKTRYQDDVKVKLKESDKVDEVRISYITK